MIKKTLNIIVSLMIGIIFLSSFVYGKNFNKNGIYKIDNPITYTSVICNGDGNIIMKTMNSGNEFIDILNDEKTNEPTLIYKRIEGESKVDKKYYKENGELDYEYSLPSYRMELYDIDGKYIDFNVLDVSYISNVVGDKVIYYKDVEGMSNRHAFIYDIKKKKEEKAKYYCVDVIKDKKIIVMSNYPYYEKGKREMVICDYDFNEIKKIDNYNYEYGMNVDGKTFIKLVTIVKENEESKRHYNVLDDNYDFIFDEDIDINIYANEDGIGEVDTDKRSIKYDFKNEILIKDEKKEIDKNKKNIEKEVKEKNLNSIAYGYYKTNENETLLYDNDLNLIATLNKKYNYMLNYKHNDDIVYMGDNGYFDEKKEIFVEDNDIYDGKGNLKLEKCGRADMFPEEGLFYYDKKFYDFKFNVIKEMDDTMRDDRFSREIIKDRVFYENRYDNEYMNNEKYNVYDERLNLLYENVTDSNFYTLDNAYTIIKDGKTILYNIDGSIKKVFDEPLSINHYYGDKYMTCINKNTSRYSVMDEDYNVLLANYKRLSDLKEDYCNFLNGFRYGLVDYSGNVLISFSIFDTMREDVNTSYEYIE